MACSLKSFIIKNCHPDLRRFITACNHTTNPVQHITGKQSKCSSVISYLNASRNLYPEDYVKCQTEVNKYFTTLPIGKGGFLVDCLLHALVHALGLSRDVVYLALQKLSDDSIRSEEGFAQAFRRSVVFGRGLESQQANSSCDDIVENMLAAKLILLPVLTYPDGRCQHVMSHASLLLVFPGKVVYEFDPKGADCNDPINARLEDVHAVWHKFNADIQHCPAISARLKKAFQAQFGKLTVQSLDAKYRPNLQPEHIFLRNTCGQFVMWFVHILLKSIAASRLPTENVDAWIGQHVLELQEVVRKCRRDYGTIASLRHTVFCDSDVIL